MHPVEVRPSQYARTALRGSIPAASQQDSSFLSWRAVLFGNEAHYSSPDGRHVSEFSAKVGEARVTRRRPDFPERQGPASSGHSIDSKRARPE